MCDEAIFAEGYTQSPGRGSGPLFGVVHMLLFLSLLFVDVASLLLRPAVAGGQPKRNIPQITADLVFPV
jgi:hypothetical protein